MEPVLVTIQGAMAATGLSRSKVYRLIAKEKLATVRIEGRTMVKTDSIRALGETGA